MTMRVASLLSLLVVSLVLLSGAQATFKSKKKFDDCCPTGKFCCGKQCLRNKLKPLVFCPAVVGGCCPAPTPPPPPPPPPPKPVDCCPKGKFCCGQTCQPNRLKPVILCIQSINGCCGDPEPQPKPNCCGKDQVCCGDGCISKDEAPSTTCPVNGKCGCNPKPVPLPKPIPSPPAEDCCLKGKACCGDGCIPKDELPFTSCPVAGKCGCDDPEPVPEPPKDCCPKGKFCCGDKCADDELQPFVDCVENKTFCCEEPEPEPKVPPCEQEPKVVGPCEAAIKSWSFIKETGVCEMFLYGGCEGNENRFDSKEACDKKCDPTPDDCCKPGFFCCGTGCLENGSQTFKECGEPKCCKPTDPTPLPLPSCKKTGCPKRKVCCKDKCMSKWKAVAKGCVSKKFPKKKKGGKNPGEENCCDGGTVCCGGNCIPKGELPFTTCAANIPCC